MFQLKEERSNITILAIFAIILIVGFVFGSLYRDTIKFSGQSKKEITSSP